MKVVDRTYKQLEPCDDLKDFIDSYWEHRNYSNTSIPMVIIPDSFFKIVIQIINDKLTAYFLTGIWTKEKEIIVPPNCTVFGVRFKILAPEYLLHREIASLSDSHKELDPDFLDIRNSLINNFEQIVLQLESKLIETLNQKKVHPKKLQFSQLLYQVKGDISAEEVSNQVSWSNRQINRYLNKYLGLSLKSYLNIQKCYTSYIQIREGDFFPDKGYYDQAHFIREVKKHTSQTPKDLHKKQNDRFIQLKDIKRK